MFCIMYTILVRPLLYFSCDVWNPYLVRDIKLEHSRLRRATKLPTALRHLSYGERLKALNLPSLQYRRRRMEMILMFRITNKFD